MKTEIQATLQAIHAKALSINDYADVTPDLVLRDKAKDIISDIIMLSIEIQSALIEAEMKGYRDATDKALEIINAPK
jgi:hypothetical protein